MKKPIFYAAGNGAAVGHACDVLAKKYRFSGKPAADVTHLLLPVPSFGPDGRIRGGGVLENLLADLPEDITVIGGRLEHPALAAYRRMDLLGDEEYTAHNAAITADCAIRVAGAHMPFVFSGTPMLIIGWGRIGKCLADRLRALGADATVTSRRGADRCMLQALGFRAADPEKLPQPERYRVIFNTAPTMVLPEPPKNAIKIELASKPGLGGNDVIDAGGLPGKLAPESSGQLIAQTVIRLLEESEVIL